jgi:polyisoprenoid-binding protein YceI
MDKRVVAGGVFVVVLGAGAWFFLGTQKDDGASVGTRAAPPPAVSAAPVTVGASRFKVEETGSASFLIDAPLEKIKGHWTKFRGAVDLDTSDLTKSHGEVDLDLDDLKTETFGDKDKDTAQTEHAHNWFELGSDAKDREANRWARFTFKSLVSATPAKLADAPEQNGARTLHVVANGDMWLHGVTAPKTVKLTVVVTGPVSAPTSMKITTDEPIRLSLKEHDVKPRDVGGKFLNGALEKVGKKIDDAAQVSLDISATRDAAAAPAAARTP